MPSSHFFRQNPPRRPERRSIAESGQSAVILALMFIVLLAFVGLATDAGILYMSYGQLRRAADAAALSAASQYREARPFNEITEAATQYVRLQGVPMQPGDVVVESCFDTVDPVGVIPDSATHEKVLDDPSICTYPVRKLVRVTVTTRVQLAFMQLFGWRDPIPLTTYAVSEAASLEIIIVIDTSFSMVFDSSLNNGVDDDGDGCVDELVAPTLDNPATCDSNGLDDDWLRKRVQAGVDNTPVCNGVSASTSGISSLLPTSYLTGAGTVPKNSCRPFEWVRDAAIQFVDDFVVFPYDRVGIVTFASKSTNPAEDGQGLIQSLACPVGMSCASTSKDSTIATLYSIDVSAAPLCSVDKPENINDWYNDGAGSPGICQATNTGDGLKIALEDLENARQNALRFIILLSDGAATSSDPNAAKYYSPATYACPKHVQPNSATRAALYDPYYFRRPCHDGDSSVKYKATDQFYDADDYARDQAQLIIDPKKPTIVFTIGLGAEVTENPGTGGTQKACAGGQPAGTLDYALCNADQKPSGEQLLRYIADVGDGISGSECDRDANGLYQATIGTSCGNYFYAQGGANLAAIFTEIAEEIFTRITE
jgi:hypothetical protein